MNTPTAPATPSVDVLALAQQVATATELVKALVATGQLTAEALGLATAPPAAATWSRDLVPGERILVRDLVAKTLDGLSEGTARTYGSYLRFIDQGWPASAPPEERLFTGLGDRYFDEVLPSELEPAAAQEAIVRTYLAGNAEALAAFEAAGNTAVPDLEDA